MAEKQPITVAELILKLLEYDGNLEVGLVMHSRDAGLIPGHIVVSEPTLISTPYVSNHQTLRLEATDVFVQRRKDRLRRHRK